MLPICPQLCVRFLADSNSWIVNREPNPSTVRQVFGVLSQLTFDNVLEFNKFQNTVQQSSAKVLGCVVNCK